MNTSNSENWRKIYGLVSWVGIAYSAVLAIAMLFFAEPFLTFIGVGSLPVTWTQLCGELLTLITVFYIVPARNVDRFRPHAWIAALGSRCLIALLLIVSVAFMGAAKVFLVAALIEIAIALVQVICLKRLDPVAHDRTWRKGLDTPPANRLKTIYRWVAWIGIGANMLFVLPLVFVPHWMLNFLGVGGEPVIWAQLGGLLLGIISIFYIPAISNLDRYRTFAWLAIFPSRAFGALFTFIAVVFLGANEAFLLGVLLDLPFALIQTFILVRLERLERGGAKPRWYQRDWRSVTAVLAALGIFATVGWHKLMREFPQELADESMGEYFKYGSIGTEDSAGVPYWIWKTLPKVFPEYLPGPDGYRALGFIHEAGRDLPVGMSQKKIGFDRVAINCAICHAGSVQIPGENQLRVYPGAPATTANILDYQRFLFSSANDPRFDSATLLASIAEDTRLSWLDYLLYRFLLIPVTKKELQEQSTQWTWTEEPNRPHWGAGRIEPFNPVKVAILQEVDQEVKVGDTLGTSDMMSLWNLGGVPDRALHWDGLNTNMTEVFDSSALGDGATTKSIPREKLQEMQDWARTMEAPKWPFTNDLDADLASQGAAVFKTNCASCHAPDGKDTGKVIPAAEVGTDKNRAEMWTKESAAAYNAYLGDLPWKFSNFRSTGGYLNVPLDGLWLRAPYLHNGSVPTLEDLLKPPAERPVAFTRGITDYDPGKVGFVSHPVYSKAEVEDSAKAAAGRGGTHYDTSGRGNSNEGHIYGTSLSPDEKAALIEYLKTL